MNNITETVTNVTKDVASEGVKKVLVKTTHEGVKAATSSTSILVSIGVGLVSSVIVGYISYEIGYNKGQDAMRPNLVELSSRIKRLEMRKQND